MSNAKGSGANGEFAERIATASDVVKRFALVSLEPAMRACKALSEDEPFDLAVLGQFKSGKSSLLNAVLGEAVLPVGALPVTAVVTRIVAGSERVVRVSHVNGKIEEVAPTRLAEFVTEAGNPGNRRQVTVVDVLTPAMRDLPDVRLVDTPGLGSVFTHNTEATRVWMPNVAAAMVTVSAERPLSDEDLRLVVEARETAPRVVVILTKVDLLTEAEREQVIDFLERALNEKFDAEVPVLPFSARVETQRWLPQLRENVLLAIAGNIVQERRAALTLKLNAVVQSSRDYLSVGIQAAERTDADRDRLRAAVFNEKVTVAVIREELGLAEQGVCAGTRAALEQFLLSRRAEVAQRINQAFVTDLPTWQGNLAKQSRRFKSWMEQRLFAELTPLSTSATSVGNALIEKAEVRFRRIVEAFRDRLNRNLHEATGVTVSPLAWDAKRPEITVIPVHVGQMFMIHWDLLWWLLPMKIVGGFFRRHALNAVSGEVDKNVRRLVSDWTKAVDEAVAELRVQATAWVEAELTTLDRLLAKQPTESAAYRNALREIDAMEQLTTKLDKFKSNAEFIKLIQPSD